MSINRVMDAADVADLFCRPPPVRRIAQVSSTWISTWKMDDGRPFYTSGLLPYIGIVRGAKREDRQEDAGKSVSLLDEESSYAVPTGNGVEFAIRQDIRNQVIVDRPEYPFDG